MVKKKVGNPTYIWNEDETSYKDEMICPYCGKENEDSINFQWDKGERKCPYCNKTYEYTKDVLIVYSTHPKEEE